MSDDAGPDWVREALRQFGDEVRLFARTAIDFTLHPTQFALEWSSGARHALNPLGFLATSLAVVAPANAVAAWLLHQGDDASTPWRAALGALLPFAYYLFLGAAHHYVLRLFGSRRPLRDSCAMALYAGGGPAAAAGLLVVASALVYHALSGRTTVDGLHTRGAWILIASATLSFSLFMGTLATSLGGLHRRFGIRRWHMIVASVVALVASGLAFGMLRPPGSYGLHFVLGWHRTEPHWIVGLSD